MNYSVKFISGDFLIPKFAPDFEYLSFYFQSELPICFAKYYIDFNEWLEYIPPVDFCQMFIDHSGMVCSESRLYYLLNRIKLLMNLVKKAADDFDLDTLMSIKNGEYKLQCYRNRR
jgi:hypothetical protein